MLILYCMHVYCSVHCCIHEHVFDLLFEFNSIKSCMHVLTFILCTTNLSASGVFSVCIDVTVVKVVWLCQLTSVLLLLNDLL